MAQTSQQALIARAVAARKTKKTITKQSLIDRAKTARKEKKPATVRFAGLEFIPFGLVRKLLFPVLPFQTKRKSSLLPSVRKSRNATLLGQ